MPSFRARRNFLIIGVSEANLVDCSDIVINLTEAQQSIIFKALYDISAMKPNAMEHAQVLWDMLKNDPNGVSQHMANLTRKTKDCLFKNKTSLSALRRTTTALYLESACQIYQDARRSRKTPILRTRFFPEGLRAKLRKFLFLYIIAKPSGNHLAGNFLSDRHWQQNKNFCQLY